MTMTVHIRTLHSIAITGNNRRLCKSSTVLMMGGYKWACRHGYLTWVARVSTMSLLALMRLALKSGHSPGAHKSKKTLLIDPCVRIPGSIETLLTNIVTVTIVTVIITMAMNRPIIWACALVFFLYLTAHFLYVYLESSPYYSFGKKDAATVGTRSPVCNSSRDFPHNSDEDSWTEDIYFSGEEKQWRVSFGDAPGAWVHGYPSKGGYYVLHPCFAVELDFLGLDRLAEVERPQNSSAAEEEEAHCMRMRQLGAKWWASGKESLWWSLDPKNGWDLDRQVLYFGWPAEGGVWALNTTVIGAGEMGAGKIHMATTMEERCKIMEGLGAVYYKDAGDCPLLDLSDEAVPGA